MNITLVPVQSIDLFWPDLSNGMEQSCRRSGGGLVAGDVWQACRSGNAFLFVAHDGKAIAGASVWYLQTDPAGAKLRCMALCGSGMKHWIYDMHETVKRVARDCGCVSLVSEGRPGWKRFFPKAKQVRIIYEEAL